MDFIKLLIIIFIDIWVVYTLFNVIYVCFLGGVPNISSSSETLLHINSILCKYKKNEDFVFYDLGCGSGKVAFFVAKHFPRARVVGVELNPFIVFYSKVKSFLLGYKNLSFEKNNILKMDFKSLNVDFFYCYLGDEVSKNLSCKLKNELSSDSIVIGNKFLLPCLKIVEVIDYKTLINGPLRIYKK